MFDRIYHYYIISLYQFIRLHTLKINLTGSGRKQSDRKLFIALASVMAPVIVIMVYYTQTQASYNWHAAATGLLLFVALFIATSMVYKKVRCV